MRRESCARLPQGQVRAAARAARDFIVCGMRLSVLSRTEVLLLISECASPDIPIPRRTANYTHHEVATLRAAIDKLPSLKAP